MPFDRQTSLLWVGLIAVAAVFVAAQPKTPTHDDAKNTNKAPATSAPGLGQSEAGAWPGNGPLDPLRQFFLPPGEAAKSSAAAAKGSLLSAKLQSVQLPFGLTWTKLKEQADPYDWADIDPTGYSIRFLIATVPDPVDSGLGYLFDQTLAAIQRALEMDEYVIDRAWLPWKPSATDAEKSRPDPRFQENYPGLVLFRRGHSEGHRDGEDTRSLLAVLLVGETPTSGIHKKAFLSAVKIIRNCPVEAIPEAEQERIRVIGPYFSGSSMSLRTVLVRTWQDLFSRSLRALLVRIGQDLTGAVSAAGQKGPKPKWKFPFIQVVCGAANGFDGAKFQQGWALPCLGRGERAFTTTVLPEALLRKWVYKYLDNPTDPVHGEQPNIMVILRESNTWFGRSALKESSTERPRNKLVFMVPFPLHISQLRANYTKEQQAKLDSLGLPRSSRNLPLPQEERTDAGIGREGVPAEAPLMTGVTNDLTLTSIVDTIAEKRARYVGLIATDVRDKIFLADMIRERFPDVQLFTTGGDLLFTHPDYSYALKGMIVGSTYPLHPLRQSWSLLTDHGTTEGPERQRVLFPNDDSEGYYNAVRVHLTEDGKTPDRMMDYGWVEEPPPNPPVTSPPVWISAVGQNNQMVPLCFIPPGRVQQGIEYEPDRTAKNLYDTLYQRPLPRQVLNQGNKAKPGTQVHSATFPNVWLLLFLALLVASGTAFWNAAEYIRRSSWSNDAEEQVSRYCQLTNFAILCISMVVLFGTAAYLACVPIVRGDIEKDPWAWRTAWIVLFLSLGVMAVVVLWILWVYFGAALGRLVHRATWVYFGVALGRLVHRATWVYFGVALGRLVHRATWVYFGAALGRLFPVAVAFVMCFAVVAAGGWAGNRIATFYRSISDQEVLAFDRWVHLSSGLTPLLPLLFLYAGLFTWAAFLIKRLYLANQFDVPCPFPPNGLKHFQELSTLDGKVRAEFRARPTGWKHAILYVGGSVLLVLCLAKMLDETIPPRDVGWLIWLALAGVFVDALLIVWTLLRFYFAWRKLKRMLRLIALLPMVDAFDRVPDKVTAIFGHYVSSERPRHSHLAILVQQYSRLRAWLPDFQIYVTKGSTGTVSVGEFKPPDLVNVSSALTTFLGGKATTALADAFDKELDADERDYEKTSCRGTTAKSINEIVIGCFSVLRTLWPIHPMEEAFGRPHPVDAKRKEPKKFLSLPAGDPIREWAMLAEDFAAIEVIRYVSQFFVQLRNMVTPLTIGSLLLILAAASYSFVPQNLLLLFLTALGAVVATAIVVFLIQVNRDELVSRITRSTPHRFTPDFAFIQGAATYVLPIVGALLIQFPFFTSMLRSFVEPLFHIIK